MRTRVLSVVALVALVATVLIAGTVAKPRAMAVNTDALGPASGLPVADYLAAAQASLTGDTAPRWALVSLRTELTPAAAAALTDRVRVSTVLYRVPIARVQTPIVTVAVPAGHRAVVDSAGYAASESLGQSGGSPQSADDAQDGDRADQIAAVCAARIRASAPAVVALTVYASVPMLRVLAADPAVRAVEALPADALAGHYGVTALLPEQTDRVLPGPDDGVIPPSG